MRTTLAPLENFKDASLTMGYLGNIDGFGDRSSEKYRLSTPGFSPFINKNSDLTPKCYSIKQLRSFNFGLSRFFRGFRMTSNQGIYFLNGIHCNRNGYIDIGLDKMHDIVSQYDMVSLVESVNDRS